MIKRICALILLICVLLLTSCGKQQEKWEGVARQELSIYTPSNNVALVIDNKTFYLNNFTLEIDNMSEKEYSYNSYYLDGSVLYFSTSLMHGFDSYMISLYSCDLITGDLNVVFRRDGYDMGETYVSKDKFYIKHFTKSNSDNKNVTVIDLYNIKSGDYTRIDNGPNATLDMFKVNVEKEMRYSVELLSNKNQKYFNIVDTETNLTKIVDNEFMLRTPFSDIFSKYGYAPRMIDVVEGHILMAFYLSFGNFIAYNNTYVVFEYDFENETLEYQLLAFPYDTVNLKFLYINGDS